jgi:hypothetical protein
MYDKESRLLSILGGVDAHEHLGLTRSVLEHTKEDCSPLLHVGRGQHPQTEGSHPAHHINALDATKLLSTIGVRRGEGHWPLPALLAQMAMAAHL